jgi:ABC-type transport system involved in multi-copper enzyme maturation permease subunit
MLVKLIIKDFKAYKNLILFRLTLPMLVVSSIFVIQLYRWDVYLMISCMYICSAGSTFLFTEKKKETEILTCSLPTTRSAIVTARYLTSVIISGLGIILFYLNAYVADFLYTNPVTHFWQINNLKVLFLVLFFLSIFMSIYLPAVFSFRFMGMAITFAIAIITAIFFVATIFKPWARSFTPYLKHGEFAVLSLIIFLPFISFILSTQIYKTRDQ